MTLNWFNNIFSRNPEQTKNDQQHNKLQEWSNLFTDIERHMDKSPDDPEVQKLVDRWESLMKQDIHQNNISATIDTKTMIVPEGIREYAAEFADPSAFIQKAIAYKYKNIVQK